MRTLTPDTETLPVGRPLVAESDVMTAQQYSDAYVSGCARTARFLISRGSSPELAEETAQAAWVKGWEHRANLRESDKVMNWVNTIAFNMYRGGFRRREVDRADADIAISPQTGPGAIDVQRVLARCSPAERELLQGHYTAGYTSKELAQRMNCSPVTVRVRLLRLRRRIQTAMNITASPTEARQSFA